MALNRRQVLKGALASGGAFLISGTKASGNILGANETIRVAVAGLNGRGSSHVGAYLGMKNVEIAYLVDPDKRTYSKHLGKFGSQKPQLIQDIRKALEDKNLHAVSIATPNHWHSLMTIWACQAGKDVYVEKPCSHNVHEGRIAVEMAKKFKCIVQHGTQSRSDGGWHKLASLVKSNKLGKLLVSRALCYKARGSIGEKPNAPAPADVDFDLWLGPAPEQSHHGNLVHYNWHWFWDFGNGDIGNQGVHQMDVARWMIPNATLPKAVYSFGGRFGYKDQAQTPNTQVAMLDFGGTWLIFEVRGLRTGDFHGQKVGNILHFEAGIVSGKTFYPKDSDKPAPLPEVDAPPRASGDIFGNFIAAVRSRKEESQHAHILEGHYSSALGHLANISYRLGQPVPMTGEGPLDQLPEAQETLERMRQHLSKDNGLDLSSIKCTLGRKLTVDALTEKFVNDNQANELLTRVPRKPYAVPEKV